MSPLSWDSDRTLDVERRLAGVDWPSVDEALRERPWAALPALLTPAECAAVASLWDDPDRFRSRVEMARHRFGQGEYRYFARPLPPLVEALRRHAYPPLAAIANGWMEALRAHDRFPATLDDFEAVCARAGQRQPTPLLLRYEEGGYNCLR